MPFLLNKITHFCLLARHWHERHLLAWKTHRIPLREAPPMARFRRVWRRKKIKSIGKVMTMPLKSSKSKKCSKTTTPSKTKKIQVLQSGKSQPRLRRVRRRKKFKSIRKVEGWSNKQFKDGQEFQRRFPFREDWELCRTLFDREMKSECIQSQPRLVKARILGFGLEGFESFKLFQKGFASPSPENLGLESWLGFESFSLFSHCSWVKDLKPTPPLHRHAALVCSAINFTQFSCSIELFDTFLL